MHKQQELEGDALHSGDKFGDEHGWSNAMTYMKEREWNDDELAVFLQP